MSKRDFKMLLLRQGIKRGSGSYEDYESAKKLVKTYCVDSKDYERLVKIATDFIRI